MTNLAANIEIMCSSFYEKSLNNGELNVLKYYMQKEATAQVVISFLNKLINRSDGCHKGLTVLKEILEYCPASIIKTNSVFWLKICCSKTEREQTSLTVTLLKQLIELSCIKDDYNKSVVPEYLPHIVEQCLNSDALQVESALKCLIMCFQTFPSTCGVFKNRFEAHLLKFLDCESTSETAVAAKAFHFLQQVGGAGAKGVNHAENWSSQFKRLCATVNVLYEEFFADQQFTIIVKDASAPYEFTAIPSSTRPGPIIKNRLKNCFLFVKAMLNGKFPTQKLIPVRPLVQIIRRGLMMHLCLNQTSLSDIETASLLLEIQIEVFSLMRSVFVCLRLQLLPFGLVLTKTLVESLGRTQKCDCFRNNSEYRIAVYKTLNLWVTINGNRFDRTFHEKCIAMILKDVEQPPARILLNWDLVNPKKMNGTDGKTDQSGKENADEDSDNSDLDRTRIIDRPIDENVAVFGLQCLTQLLKRVSLKINAKLTTRLYKFAVRGILSIQNGENSQPFTKPECIINLYKTLVSLFEQPLLPVPLPLDIAIELFAKAQHHKNQAIASVCQNGLNVLEKLCQPICPSLELQKVTIPADQKEFRLPKERSPVEMSQSSSRDLFMEVTLPATGTSEMNSSQFADSDVVIVQDEPSSSVKRPAVCIISNIVIKDSQAACTKITSPIAAPEKLLMVNQNASLNYSGTESLVGVSESSEDAILPTQRSGSEPPFKKPRTDVDCASFVGLSQKDDTELPSEIAERADVKVSAGDGEQNKRGKDEEVEELSSQRAPSKDGGDSSDGENMLATFVDAINDYS